MGTRFMMTQESPVPGETKKAYISAEVDEIKITKKFDGLSHRLIFNKYKHLLGLQQRYGLGTIVK